MQLLQSQKILSVTANLLTQSILFSGHHSATWRILFRLPHRSVLQEKEKLLIFLQTLFVFALFLPYYFLLPVLFRLLQLLLLIAWLPFVLLCIGEPAHLKDSSELRQHNGLSALACVCREQALMQTFQ